MRKVIKQAGLGFVLALALLAGWPAVASAYVPLYVHAQDRATGNRPVQAVALARALLTRLWPASVLQVRVDGFRDHLVAGLVISGVKFHGALDTEGFLREVESLVRTSFSSSTVEEVDVWATEPIAVAKGAVVSGDLAVPTSRVVFGVTIRRGDLGRLDAALRAPASVYWDASFAAHLRNGS